MVHPATMRTCTWACDMPPLYSMHCYTHSGWYTYPHVTNLHDYKCYRWHHVTCCTTESTITEGRVYSHSAAVHVMHDIYTVWQVCVWSMACNQAWQHMYMRTMVPCAMYLRVLHWSTLHQPWRVGTHMVSIGREQCGVVVTCMWHHSEWWEKEVCVIITLLTMYLNAMHIHAYVTHSTHTHIYIYTIEHNI